MMLSQETRDRFHIAASFDEAQRYAQEVSCCGQTGFPVLLVPFGNGERRELPVRTPDELHKAFEQALHYARFGMVHVLKQYRHPYMA